MKTVLFALALALAMPIGAQEPMTYARLCGATEGTGDSNDFCALWAQNNWQGMRNALSISIRTARAAENRNRYYFDHKRGAERGAFIQLKRPWMDEAALFGDGGRWEIRQQNQDGQGSPLFQFHWSENDLYGYLFRFNLQLVFVDGYTAARYARERGDSARRVDSERLFTLSITVEDNTGRRTNVVEHKFFDWLHNPLRRPQEAKVLVECILDRMRGVMYEDLPVADAGSMCGVVAND